MVTRIRQLTPLLVAGAALITTAGCATTYAYRGPRDGYYQQVERRAYDNGYHEGAESGEKDGRRGRPFSFSRHDEWRDADEGYHRDFGDRDFYSRNFRRGFEAGYTNAYNRFGNYDRRGGYPSYPTYGSYPSYPSYPAQGGIAVPRGSYSPASQNGYRDGVDQGRDDANDRKPFDPVRAKRYREGDHDYDNRYGSRDVYKQEYRAGFQQGYQDGYRGVRR